MTVNCRVAVKISNERGKEKEKGRICLNLKFENYLISSRLNSFFKLMNFLFFFFEELSKKDSSKIIFFKYSFIVFIRKFFFFVTHGGNVPSIRPS